MDFLRTFKPYFLNGLGHWYLQGWFIALMFLLSFLIIPPFIGIALIMMQNLQTQELFKQLNEHEGFQNEKSSFDDYVETKSAELNLKEKAMSELTKNKIIALMKKDYSKSLTDIESLKESARNYCLSKNTEADDYFKQRVSEADGYEHSVFLKCGAMKEELDTMRLEIECLLKSREKLYEERKEYQAKVNKYVQDELEIVNGMEDGHEFEYYFAELLKKCGYIGVVVTPGSGDFGVDVVAQKWGIPFAFQCKRYSQQVGNKAVQEIFSGMHTCDCNIGVVVTNNTFTNGAISQARKNRILLWGREELTAMIAISYDIKQ